MTPPNQSSIIFAALVVFLCYFCCGSSRNFVIAMDNDGSSKGATTTTATNFLRRPTDSRVLVVVNDAATVEEKRELMPLASNKCGCSTCTEEVLNADAGGFSCGARINWMVDSLSYIEEDACNLVAGEEFPLGMYCSCIVLCRFVLYRIVLYCMDDDDDYLTRIL